MRHSEDERVAVENILGSGFIAHRLLEAAGNCPITGPAVWWAGPLNVEKLAARSVGLVCTALNALAASSPWLASETPDIAAAFASSAHLRIAGEKTQGFAPYSGFYRTADGWIRTHANYPHHEHSLKSALGASAGIKVADALASLSAHDAQERIVAAGGIAAQVRSRQQWLSSAEGKVAGSGHWAQFRMRPIGSAPVWKFEPRAGMPLHGLKVLDLTRVIAGPTATRTLAALGAQVLRVDGPLLPELPWQYVDTGFGKRSTLLDLKSASGQARIHELLQDADAVILGYRPGALARAGLGENELAQRYPELIVAELGAWGFSGPWAQRRGFDSIVQAATGISQVYRGNGQSPGALPVQALDHATGYGLAAAIIALVRARSAQGRTGSVRFSLARTAHALFAFDATQQPAQFDSGVRLKRMDSAYGTLEYVPPPFSLAGQALDYADPPAPYGEDEPVWS
ncbi:CoA transferase [Glutamicibacter sp.]|uniref:CoA transferase n=1 Tax=Glutamicibacter sp. TaxID=1931995 RepID=UPI003D6A8E1C